MKLLIALLMLLAAVATQAANPAFQDFNTNQFGTAGNKVAIKSGPILTNVQDTGTSKLNALQVSNAVQTADIVISNNFLFQSGAGNGFVLTSDGSGQGTWQPAAGGDSVWTNDSGVIYPIGANYTNDDNRFKIFSPALGDYEVTANSQNGTTEAQIRLEADTVDDEEAEINIRYDGGTEHEINLKANLDSVRVQLNAGGDLRTKLDPTAVSGSGDPAYLLDTFSSQADATDVLLSVRNLGTNEFQVDRLGDISLSGRTNKLSVSATPQLLLDGSPVADTTFSNVVTLTYSGSTNISQLDFALVQNGGVFKLSLTNNGYIAAPANVATSPFRKAWLIVQNSGGFILQFTNGHWAWPEKVSPIVDTNSGSVSVFQFVSDVFTNSILHGTMTPWSATATNM